jgi:hypothetical protein
MAVGTQTAIIGDADHLKCKLLSGTLKEAALRWYMNLPKHSIENWLDFQRKFTQQFSGSKHIKVAALRWYMNLPKHYMIYHIFNTIILINTLSLAMKHFDFSVLSSVQLE